MKLKQRARIINGFAFKSDQFKDVGIPVVRQSNLKAGRIVHDGKCYSAELTPKSVILKEGDVCIGLSGSIENFGVVDEASLPCALNQRVGALRAIKGNSEPNFIKYLVQSNIFKDHIAANLPSTTIANADVALIGDAPYPEVDIHGQVFVADFLDRQTARIDQLIEKRSRFAQLLLERRLALISRAATGTTDVAHWLENLPDGWTAERAKVHFRESQKRSDTGEEELLTVSHITGVTKRSEKDVYMFMAESNEGYKLVAPGDLIINTMWAWMGAMGVSSENGLISPSYGVYTPVSDALRPAFIDLMVRSKPFVAEATRRSKGIHSSRLRLYPDAFLDMRLHIPPLETQDAMLQEVSSRIRREDELLRKNERAETLLREFRAALITAAVTGQIDVATWGKQGNTDRRLDQIEEDMTRQEVRA